MKNRLLLLLLCGTPWVGALAYGGSIDGYDPATNLYYKAVQETPRAPGFFGSKRGPDTVVNVNIFDPATGASRLLFGGAQAGGISVFLFEKGFHDGTMEIESMGYGGRVLDNVRVDQRPPRNRLLVGVDDPESRQTTLYVADKKGGDLRKLATVPADADWHLDVRNAKLRVVHQTGGAVRIDSYDW